jgi:D-alanyl-D-alanine carboxypeptidase
MGASLFPSVGMTSIPVPYSHGYWPQENGDGLSDITEIDPSSHWTSGAIISNVYDLRIWGEALAKGSLLSPAMQDQRLIWVNNPNDSNKFYGLGIMKFGEFLGHDGTMPGFESLVYHLPSRNATIVVLANTLSPPNPPPQEEIFKAIVELLIPEAAIWKK